MRVLAISGVLPRPGRPGSLAPVARQIESIRRLGVEFDVLELDGPKKIKYASAWTRLMTRCRAADIVHAHFGYSGWLGLLQPWRPVVISYMGNDLLGSRTAGGELTTASRAFIRLNQYAARRANALIVKTAEMATMLPDLNVQIIPNGVDMTRFAPTDRLAARHRVGWPRDGLIALFPGCPDFPNKGFDIASAAIAHASKILGRPVETRVLWNVDPDDVPAYMSASDAMILASKQEGSPNVVKEALACELPVVATAVGDVPELLSGADGCYVCARTPEALGEALARALPLGRLTCGREILMKRRLDEDSVAARVVALYHSVIDGGGARE